ncbi:MAG: SLBB domain-containing protein [Armatimonadota bacterium]|nr:SLBB domain-containing protein [Armatimonadota bacterium]
MAQAAPDEEAEPGEEPPAAPEVVTQPGGLPLRAGDVLTITVQGEPELSGTAYVRPDGTISLPMLGSVPVAGSTPTELADALTQMLRRYVVNPQVTVLHIGGVARVVSVIGAVHGPGTYDVRQYSSLLPLLAAAGGPRPDADLERAVLVRGGEQARVVREVVEGEPIIPEDIGLEAGDTLVVPSIVERSVRVAGAVMQPGLVPLEEGLTASRAVLAAGGPAEVADLGDVQLLRGAERMDLNLQPLLRPEVAAGEEQVEDPVLGIDDVLIVPRMGTQAIMVIGAVQAPGPQDAGGARLASKAVAAAGGAAVNGDLSRAYVLQDGERIELELRPLLDPGSAPEGMEGVDTPVRAGDVVVVPERSPVFVIGAVNTPGELPPQQADTVSRAVVMAGGLAPDADASGAYVLRAGEQIQVDLPALLDEGDASADLPLEPQDALVVPRRPQMVHVVGQVNTPGSFPLESVETVADAWALAGGETPMALTTACLLVRGEHTETLNIEALVNEGDATQNRALQAGDTIIVPKISDEVYIFGAVLQPGKHAIHEGDTVIDVIADAGGPAPGARINRVALIRRERLGEVRAQMRREEEAGPAEAPRRPERRRGPQDWRQRLRGRPQAEPERAGGDRQERIAQKIAEGSRALHLFDLASVPPDDPRYLVHPGDVIYIPPRSVRGELWERVIDELLVRTLGGMLF